MEYLDLVKNDTLECAWDPAPYLLFSAEVEPLVYYSHLFPAVAILILSFVVLKRSAGSFPAKLFFVIGLLFATFAIFDLILWATEKPSLIMFLWSLLTYIEPLIYIFSLYFVYTLTTGKDATLLAKGFAGLLLLPIFIFGPTNLNLSGFDYTNCWRLATEGPLATYYVYIVEIVVTLWMILLSVKLCRSETNSAKKHSIIYLLVGTLFFLLAFSSGNIFGTLLQGSLGEDAWVIGQYGFFGMPIFLGFIMYLLVKFELFTARVVYAEAIILSLFVSLMSLLLIPDVQAARPIILITLLLFSVLGHMLVQGIKQDIQQRKEIEKLASKLKKANKRLRELDQMKSEFVSIASHQLRSPLTSIRGYTSMLLEGSYGKLTNKATVAIERIADSSAFMAKSVEDYLNVSRIEAGNMKYELTDFNLKNEVEHVADDKRQEALKKGLLITFKSDLDTHGIVNADIGKTRQILHNLINNAIKYTPRGTVTLFVYDDKKKKKIYVDIIDSGIGMKETELCDIFGKFERAHNANETNVTGTGLGLFVARKMAHAMGSDVTAHSDGVGHGSTFRLTMPLQM